MTGLTAESERFWDTHCRWCGHDKHGDGDDVRCAVVMGSSGGPTPEPDHCECTQWSDVLAMVARREAAAVARILDPDRIARVLHEECEAAWDYIEATDPTRRVTGHFWDVHRATGRHIAARLREGA